MNAPGTSSNSVELTTPQAWLELIQAINEVIASADGRLVIRTAAGDAATAGSREFHVRFQPATENGRLSESPAVTGGKLQPVRIVNDPDAPALQPQDVDRLYPWRQKDLLL